MKTKKSLAFVLALIMILTLIPASAFAATSNSVDRVPVVAAEEDIPAVTLSLKVGPGNFTSTDQAIKLSLENAVWQNDPATVGDAVTNDVMVVCPNFVTANAISVTDVTAEFTFETSADLVANEIIELTLLLESGDAAGDVKVRVDGLDSSVSSGTYTVAVVGSGKTTTTVSGSLSSTWRTSSFEAATIEIRENAVNSVDNAGVQTIRLTLPSGMTWEGLTTSGNLGTVVPGVMGGRDLEIAITPSPDNNLREVLNLIPEVAITKDAKMGDITVTIRNITTGATDKTIANSSSLIVGKYVDESVKVTTVKEADLPEFVAGRVDADYEVEITVEEVIASALASGRFIDFEFSDWVQITSGASVTLDTVDTTTNDDWDNETGALAEDHSSFEYTLADNLSNTAKEEYTFKVPVTIDAGTPAGDITVKVSGAKAGIEDTTLVVGKVLAPISAEIKVADLKAGVQNQALGEIIIKEEFAGAIMENQLVLTLEDIRGSLKNVKAEVISGDIEIDDFDTDVNADGEPLILINIDNESVGKASEIKISGATVTLDRTPAEGKYEMSIGGTALVENAAYNDGDFSGSVISTDCINVVTPADQGVNATFVIGNKDYTLNGVAKTMDAAPYIDAAGRTMVPIRYVANAMGISDNLILWSQATQTATIFGDKVVTIKIGSNTINANGATITMDTTAVNSGGRIYVPARFVSNALGADVEWDQAAKTVRIFTVK